MTGRTRLATYFHVHLVSDSTGETLNALARAACARFTNVLPIEHIYALVRSPPQLERALEEIANAPGVVLHTIIDPALRSALDDPLPEYAHRASELVAPFSRAAVTATISGRVLPRLLPGWGP